MIGHRDRAEAILRGLVEADDAGVAAPFDIAMAYVGLGNSDLAFEWLDRAARELDPWITAVNAERLFDPLHSDRDTRHCWVVSASRDREGLKIRR